MATLALLEELGVTVVYPTAQTCCGQPLINTGCTYNLAKAAAHFVDTFCAFDYIVSPSASCAAAVRHHYHKYVPTNTASEHVINHTFELCEFLTDVLKIESLNARFPHKVGLHHGCHGLREFNLASCSERNEAAYSKPVQLLNMVKDLELVKLNRADECCGFGGTFAVDQESVSCAMGRSRVHDHVSNGATVIISTDTSCLMHLEGIMGKQKESIATMHIAQVLRGESL